MVSNNPRRVQRRRGQPLPAGARDVSRASRYGNPWPVGKTGPDGHACANRGEAVDRHRAWLQGQHPAVTYRGRTGSEIADEARNNLAGTDLACACPVDDAPCHAATLLVLANPMPALDNHEELPHD